MNTTVKRTLVTAVTSFGIGSLSIIPIVNSENGYVSGYVFFPLQLLIAACAFILFCAGLITITRRTGPYLILASLLLPVGFISSGIFCKYFEIGAYYQEPMSPIVGVTANKVLFKKDATNEEIDGFWTDIIGYRTDEKDSHWIRPGVKGVFRGAPENGHEVIMFEFLPNATEEQKEEILKRIRIYPPVHELRANDGTSLNEVMPQSAANGNVMNKTLTLDK